MGESTVLLTKLEALSACLGNVGGCEENLREVAAAAAKNLNAETCSVMLLSENERKEVTLRVVASYGQLPPAAYAEKVPLGQGIAGYVAANGKSLLLPNILQSDFATCARRPEYPGNSAVSSPIRDNGHVLGVVNVSGARGRPPFDAEDVSLLEIVALVIGKSNRVVQLQNLLKSRFIQHSLIEGTEKTISELLVSAGRHPDQMARIVAKSFYREMTNAGFSSGQIIDAASEIISELSNSLQKHRERVEKSEG